MEDVKDENMLTASDMYENTVGSALDKAWSREEKERFLKAMKLYGLEDTKLLTKCVMTKTERQVQAFIDMRIKKAHRRSQDAYRLIKNKAPIDIWRDTFMHLQGGNSRPKDFSKALGKVMKDIAAGNHPIPQTFSCPNYERIYNFLGCTLRGVPSPTLSPTDSFIVLELIKMMASLMKGINLEEQKLLIKKHVEEERDKVHQTRGKQNVAQSAEGHIDPCGGIGEPVVPDTSDSTDDDTSTPYVSALFNPSVEYNSLNVLNLPPEVLQQMANTLHGLNLFSSG